MEHFRTPLGRARGLGSAKHGVAHFIVQRVTATALVILIPVLLVLALALARSDYATAARVMAQPLPATAGVLLAIAVFWHMYLGMRVIIEDYSGGGTRIALLIVNVFVCFAGAAGAVISLLRVALSGHGGL